MSDKRYGPSPTDMVTQWDAASDKTPPGWTPRKDIEAIGGKIHQDEGIILVTISSDRTPDRTILPGKTSLISFSSDVGWCAKSFSVPEEICRHFKLMSLQCGRVEYVPNGGVDCSVFSDAQCVSCRKQKVSEKLNISWPTVFAGATLGVCVKNVSDVPMVFRGTFEASPIGTLIGCL